MLSVDLLSSQSGHGSGRGISIWASTLNQAGRVETCFCDGSIIGDGKSRKSHAAHGVESSPLKVRSVPGSHGMSNLLVMDAIPLRTLWEPVR